MFNGCFLLQLKKGTTSGLWVSIIVISCADRDLSTLEGRLIGHWKAANKQYEAIPQPTTHLYYGTIDNKTGMGSYVQYDKDNVLRGKYTIIREKPESKQLEVNYHRQRRWLEILVLKGTILFIVLTRTNLCAALQSAYPFSPGVLHIALSVPLSVPLYLRNILSTTGAAPNTASLLPHIFGTVSAIASPSDIP